ncbi:MAG TPA: potassium-transporting ATPase subunit KdpC [Trebonia sp.]
MRSGILRQAAVSIIAVVIATVALGFGYPLVVTGVSDVFFHSQANGSLIYANGKLVGSSLLGQSFTDAKGNPLPRYFQPRPSEAGSGYDGISSGASNLGPSNPVLVKDVAQRAAAYRAFNHMALSAEVPVDAVTASASGLDPDISIQNALDQAPRVAQARHLSLPAVLAVLHQHTTPAEWGFLSEPVVNVLQLNLSLESFFPDHPAKSDPKIEGQEKRTRVDGLR